jgi:hypothetical protein
VEITPFGRRIGWCLVKGGRCGIARGEGVMVRVIWRVAVLGTSVLLL